MDFTMRPIGMIQSPFKEKGQTPIQSTRSQATGLIDVYPEFAPGLQDLDGFSHIIILYVFNQSNDYSLHIKPFLDDQERGLFATRYPYRPNPIGLSIVRLVSVQDHFLTVEGIDVLDQTPLLDIKPYVPDFDLRENTRTGWYETRSKK